MASVAGGDNFDEEAAEAVLFIYCLMRAMAIHFY